jgi:hypothetical protein
LIEVFASFWPVIGNMRISAASGEALSVYVVTMIVSQTQDDPPCETVRRMFIPHINPNYAFYLKTHLFV